MRGWTTNQYLLGALVLVQAQDVSFSIVSFEAFWISLGGNAEKFGFMFATYYLLSDFTVALLRRASRRFAITNRALFISALLLSAAGNAIYALGAVALSTTMVLAGRLLSGVGSSGAALALAYVGDKAPKSAVLGTLKLCTTVSRAMGPLLGAIVTVHEADLSTASELELLFNRFTWPGWLAAVSALLCAVAFRCLFDETAAPATLPVVADDDNDDDDDDEQEHRCQAVPVWLLQGVVTGLYWGFMANALVLGAVQLDAEGEQDQLWRLYAGGVVAVALGVAAFVSAKRSFFTGFVALATGFVWVAATVVLGCAAAAAAVVG